jgi:hypothetical protein
MPPQNYNAVTIAAEPLNHLFPSRRISFVENKDDFPRVVMSSPFRFTGALSPFAEGQFTFGLQEGK